MPRQSGPVIENVMTASRQTCKPAAIGGRRLVQLALDFFSPDRPADPASTGGFLNLQEKESVAQAGSAQVAIENVAKKLAPCTDSFVHPRASRQVVLDGRLVAYEVKRGKRRTIGFCVGNDGLAVSAPKWVALLEIDQAVRAKSRWILKKLADTRERHQQTESARIDWVEGACFPFLGAPVQIVLELGQGSHQAKHQGQAFLDDGPESAQAVRMLRIKLPADAPPEDIEQAAQAWLMKQARQVFTARLDFFAPQLGVQWHKLGISNAATRWGSASSSGAIRLNWRLMHLTQEVVDYVVVHELSHLRFMDHSPRFWATVESVLPGHAALRRQLKKEPVHR